MHVDQHAGELRSNMDDPQSPRRDARVVVVHVTSPLARRGHPTPVRGAFNGSDTLSTGPGLAGAHMEIVMSNENQVDQNLVAHIYATAAAGVIARQDGPAFEDVLAQSIVAARIFAEEMGKRTGQQGAGWLGAVPGMK